MAYRDVVLITKRQPASIKKIELVGIAQIDHALTGEDGKLCQACKEECDAGKKKPTQKGSVAVLLRTAAPYSRQPRKQRIELLWHNF